MLTFPKWEPDASRPARRGRETLAFSSLDSPRGGFRISVKLLRWKSAEKPLDQAPSRSARKAEEAAEKGKKRKTSPLDSNPIRAFSFEIWLTDTATRRRRKRETRISLVTTHESQTWINAINIEYMNKTWDCEDARGGGSPRRLGLLLFFCAFCSTTGGWTNDDHYKCMHFCCVALRLVFIFTTKT